MKKFFTIFFLFLLLFATQYLTYAQNPHEIFVDTWNVRGTGVDATISFFGSICVIYVEGKAPQEYDFYCNNTFVRIGTVSYDYMIVSDKEITLTPAFDETYLKVITLEKVNVK